MGSGQLLVFLDVDDAVLAVAESFGGVLATQSLDERVRAASDLLGKLDHVDTFQYDVVRLHRVSPGERRTTRHARQTLSVNCYNSKIQQTTRQ